MVSFNKSQGGVNVDFAFQGIYISDGQAGDLNQRAIGPEQQNLIFALFVIRF